MKKTITLILALLAMTASAQTTFNDGTFKYKLMTLSATGETVAMITSWYSMPTGTNVSVYVPGYVTYSGTRYRVNEIDVTGLAATGSSSNTSISSITVGYGVCRVNNFAFRDLTNLTMVRLPSSITYLGYDIFYNTKVAYVVYAGETVPYISSGTFRSGAASKSCSTSTYRAANLLKANSDWNAAFANIGRHYAYYSYDFMAYNSDGGCNQYYIIRNGIPYNYSGPTGRSSCVLVGASSTNSTYGLKLDQNISNSTNNAPGYYHFYGVADSAFMNNTYVTKIVDNSTLSERIGRYAFYGCPNLTSAQVRSDSIMGYAFYNCSKLSSIDLFNSALGKGVHNIGNFAFGQTALTSVTLPKTLDTNLGYAPFYNCQSLKTISVDSNCPSYCSYYGALYNKNKSKLYQIPGAWGHSNTTDYLPSELTSVLMYAGYGNTSIVTLKLPYGVTSIQDQAFSLMSKLATVHLPSSVTSIGQNAFRSSPITAFICAGSTPPSYTFGGVSNLSSIKLTVPYGAWGAYKSDTYWKQLSLVTSQGSWCNAWDYKSADVCYRVLNSNEAAVVSLHDGDNSILSTLYLQGTPYTVTEIGNWACYNCSNNQDMTISGANNIKRIMGRAFYNTRLTNFPFGSNLVSIEDSAFMNTSKMNEQIVFTGSALKTIDPYAFYNSAIFSFTASGSLYYIGNNAFANTSGMSSVNLSLCNNLTYIQNYCFKNSLCNSVKLPNSVLGIGKEAFRNCALVSFNFPSKLKTLDYYAFYRTGLGSSSDVELPYGITTLQEGCLASYAATKIVLPATVTYVHSRFYIPTEQTHALKSVVINTPTPLGFINDNEDINYDCQTADNIKDATIYVPVNQVATWKADPHWKKIYFSLAEGSYDFTSTTGSKHTVLSYTDSGTGTCHIVYNPDTYNNFSSIVISTVTDNWGRNFYTTNIGERCFYNSSKLNTVYLGETVREIEPYAFAGSALSKIQNEEVQQGASSPSNGFIRAGVHTIGAYAFNACKNLHELFLPHIYTRNSINCGNQFFGNNAADFKLWVDYRRLSEFIDLPATRWDESKIYPHLLLDSKWQSFACIKPINFQGTNVEAYTVTNFHTIDKIATLTNIASLGAKQGGVVHGEANGTFYRLNYDTSGSTTTWLDGVTSGSQTINSTASLSYFKLNSVSPKFEKITTNTTFYSGYAYLKLNSSFAGNATTIYTNLSDSSGIQGDVNGDGKVNVSDVTALVNMILGVIPKDEARADINGDGKVNVSDVTALINIILGTS